MDGTTPASALSEIKWEPQRMALTTENVHRRHNSVGSTAPHCDKTFVGKRQMSVLELGGKM